MIRTAADIGAVIRDRRHKLRLDQLTLAKQVGVGRQWIVDIEKGKPRAGIELVLRTLTALGLSLVLSEGAPATAGRGRPAVDLDTIIAAARRPKR